MKTNLKKSLERARGFVVRKKDNLTTTFCFGDVIAYSPPQRNCNKIPCVYIRDDNGKAVVFFKRAEWAARVNYENLTRE